MPPKFTDGSPGSFETTDARLQERIDSVWAKCRSGLDTVFRTVYGMPPAPPQKDLGKLPASKMEWYSLIYSAACSDPVVGNCLYRRIHDWLGLTLGNEIAKPLLTDSTASDPLALLRRVAEAYRLFQTNVHYAVVIFGYLNRVVPARVQCASLDKLYYKAFHEAVYEEVKGTLCGTILDQVDAYRKGDSIDMSVLKNAVALFNNVGTSIATNEEEAAQVYKDDFERAYLQRVQDACNADAQVKLSEDGGYATFLEWVEGRQDLEIHLAKQLLREGSENHVRTTVDEILIFAHCEAVVQHPDYGCSALLADWRLTAFSRMFRLMQRVPEQKALHIMAKELKARIEEEGSKLMERFNSSTSSGPLTLEKPLVLDMLELNLKYGLVIQTHLENNGLFLKYRKDAFAAFVNGCLVRRDPKPSAGENAVEEKATTFSEVLAAFVDAVLKRELKDVVDEDDERDRLDALLQLFTYIKEKDVFQDFYKAKLAKRLLQTTPHEELEKGFLERLQREMGKSFTHKMEGMLLDREATKRQSDKFATDRASSSLPSQLGVQVLTEAHWPTYKVENMDVPTSLRVGLDAFTRFYKSTYNTRKLTWVHVLGSANMTVSFTKGKKDVAASLHQAAVLVTIDERGPISATEIAKQLQLDVRSVKPHIASMYLHKVFSMLRRVDESGAPLPVGKSIADADRFEMNTEFQHKMRKFKVPVAPTAKSHHSAGMPTDMEIEGRRKIQIDAAVVRIMKSRKTLAYRELQDLVIEQLSRYFTPQPKQIKQRVEDLITREYLRRHEDNQTMFDYLA